MSARKFDGNYSNASTLKSLQKLCEVQDFIIEAEFSELIEQARGQKTFRYEAALYIRYADRKHCT
jgi:hypothetical protein